LEEVGVLWQATEVVFWAADRGTVTIRDNSGVVSGGQTGTVERELSVRLTCTAFVGLAFRGLQSGWPVGRTRSGSHPSDFPELYDISPVNRPPHASSMGRSPQMAGSKL